VGNLLSRERSAATRLSDERIDCLLEDVYCLFGQRKYDQAFKICQEIIRSDPRNAAAYNNMGSVYMVKGDLTKAHKMFHKALECDPHSPEARENLQRLEQVRAERSRDPQAAVEYGIDRARDLARAGRMDEATGLLESLVAKEPDHIRLLNNLGILWYQLANYERAEEIFMHAMEVYFLKSVPFDEQYQTIKENLRKLRAVAGSKISDVLKETLLEQVRSSLMSEEKILHCISGIISLRIQDTSDRTECSIILVATSRRLILYGRSTVAVEGHGPVHGTYREEFPYDQVADVQSTPGIAKSSLTVTLAPCADRPHDDRKRTVTSAARDDIRAMAGVLKEILERRARRSRDQAASSDPRVAVNLMRALRDMDVISEEELQRKKLELRSRHWT